jgi:hypothetical protein
MATNWRRLESGLALREDEFSWQGSRVEDNRFFLRREKSDPRRITDLLTGEAPRDVSALLFADFLRYSGGLEGQDSLVFLAIAKKTDDYASVVQNFNSVTQIIDLTLGELRVSKRHELLQDSLEHWNAIVFFDFKDSLLQP